MKYLRLITGIGMLLLLTATAALAQDSTITNTAFDPYNSSIYNDRAPFGIFIEPSALMPWYYNGSARAGIEVPVLPMLSFTGIYCLYSDGYGFKGILKLYGDNMWPAEKRGSFKKVDERHYIALECYYKDYAYTNEDSVIGKGIRDYHVSKSAITFSIMGGDVATWRNGIYYEWLAGIGVRVKTVRNDLADGESDHFYHWHEGFVTSITDSNTEDAVLPHIALGFRIGWRYR
jgi:hypothetical protein